MKKNSQVHKAGSASFLSANVEMMYKINML